MSVWGGEVSYNKLVEILSQLTTVRDSTKYLPVRLTDGSAFYNAGGGGSVVDVSDRVARLLGIIYGNLDQLQQKPTTKELLVWINNFPTDYFKANQNIGSVANLLNPHPVSLGSIPNPSNLDVLLSTRATGAILNPHPVSLSTLLNPHPVSLASIPNPTNLDVALSTRATGALLNPHPVDVSDRAARLLGVIAASSNIIGKVGIDQTTPGTTNKVDASLGVSTGKTNVLKTGNLVTTATTVDQVILTYTVTSGKTFYLEYLSVDCRLTTFAATATWFGAASLENPAGTKLITDDLSGTGAVTRPPYVFSEPIPIASGTVIRVVCTPGAATSYTWKANFGGYEK